MSRRDSGARGAVRQRWRPVFAAVALLAPAAHTSAAPSMQATAWQYGDAIALFRAGETEAAAETLRALRDGDVVREANRFPRARPVTAHEWRTWSGEVCAAILLHTAVWAGRAAPGPAASADVHGQAARTLVRLLLARTTDLPDAQRDGNREFARQWYLLVASHLHAVLNIETSRAHLAEARRAFPDDGQILLASGADHEALSAVSTGWIQFRGVKGERRSQERVEPARELRRAAKFYRGATAAEPDLDEARLRLGRVLHLLGETAAARDELLQVHTRTTVPAFKYLAAVFLALLEAADQQYARARDLYAEASRIHPGGHAVLVGRSDLAYRTGKPGEAAGVMRDLLRRDTAIDPWWGYLLATSWHLEVLQTSLQWRARE